MDQGGRDEVCRLRFELCVSLAMSEMPLMNKISYLVYMCCFLYTVVSHFS